MNKEKYLQFIAAFVIILLFNFIFYVPRVHASINSVSIKGSGGIAGFAKQNDALDIEALVSIGNSTIKGDQIFLGSTISFDSCSGSGNQDTKCTVKFPSTGSQDLGNKPLQFVINLFKNSSQLQLDDSKTASVVVDNQPPNVKISIPKSVFSGQENIVVTYEATDTACSDPTCTGFCVGIKDIEIDTNGTFKKTIDPNATGCSVVSTIAIESTNVKDGLNSISAKATDKFGQVSTQKTISFTVDAVPPNIVTNSLVILRRGISLNTFSPQSVPVEVMVNISAPDLDPNSVTADLSELNPSLNSVRGSCSPAGIDLHTCRWPINLNPGTGSSQSTSTTSSQQTSSSSTVPSRSTQSGTTSTSTPTSSSSTKTIEINASDLLGNRISVKLSKPLALDDKGPDIFSLTTDTELNGVVYARPDGNKVIATITEATGLSADEVFLHVGNNRIAASSCQKQSSWECIWNNVGFGTASPASMSIKSDTIDLLLNPVSQDKTVSVTIDNTPPAVNQINITPVGTISPTITEIFKVEDKIAVLINVTEENELIALADFSKFIGGAKNIPGTCSKFGDHQLCTWLSDSLSIPGTNDIEFNFTDPVRHSTIVSHSLTVLGLENTTAPDFWKNQVTCSPRTVDRQLGPFINQRVYCQVHLLPNSNPSTVFIGPPACSGDTTIVQNVESFNREFGSTTPFIKFTLKKDEFKIDEANITCRLDIFSKIGDRITKFPEIEEANISIKFYNLPLGEVSQEVQDKIDEAKKDAQGIWKVVGAMNKAIFYAKKICQIFGMIYTTVSIYYTITAKTKAAEDVCVTSGVAAPFCEPPLHVASEASCYGQQGLQDAADKGWVTTGGPVCKFVNCQWAPGVLGDWQNYMTEKINSLPGADFVPGPGALAQPGIGSLYPILPSPDGTSQDDGGQDGTNQDGASQDDGEQKKPLDGRRDGLAGYMDPNNNLFVAGMFGCIPGIVTGLEKYRQIKCLYADCLENSVAQDGLPVTACENLKKHATCKYIYGEVFAAIPYTAVFDHFTGIIKEALSNPFTAAGIGIGAACYFTCPQPPPGASAGYIACAGFRVASKLGEVLTNVRGLVDEGFKPRQDYCSRLDFSDVDSGSDSSSDSTPQSSDGVPSRSLPSSSNTQSSNSNTGQ